MPTADRLRVDDTAGGGTPSPLVAGQSRAHEVTRANMGTADVRSTARAARTVVLTELGAGAGDTYMVGAYSHGADGDFVRTDTTAIAYDATAATTLRDLLRTATGDASLTCTGSAGGPYTITYVAKEGQPELVVHTCTGAMAVQVSRSALTYDDVPQTGTAGTLPSSNGVLFDQESSKGIGADIPLGYGTDSDGTAVTRGDELLPPTVDGAAGGSGEVVITATEVASGGTSALVLYAIRKLDLADHATQYVTVDSEDADGDVTISSLSAGDYVLLAHTQTANGKVSRPAAPVYFSVA